MFATSLPDNQLDRKTLGAWYTPRAMVEPLARWAVRSPEDHVLDPAVGDGIFLEEAARLFRQVARRGHARHLHGIDVNPEAIAVSRVALAEVLGDDDNADLQLADFFHVEPPYSLFGEMPLVDAVVGNPPYVRYQTFGKQARKIATLRAARGGVRLTNLCSAWAPFVVHAISFLKPGGRLAFVLPEELLHASYATAVREHVRKSFKLTVVVRFEHNVFPEAQERVVFLLAEGKDEQPVGELRLASAHSLSAASDLSHLIQRAEVYPPDTEPGKWEPGFEDGAAAILRKLAADGHLVPLRTVGKASIGYVTGANDFFVMSPSRAGTLRFPMRVLKPTVIAARHVPGAVFTTRDLQQLVAGDERCYLWTGEGERLRSIARYIREGQSQGIHKRYKCRVREPWYVVPGVARPDAFMTYMSDEIPRLVLNETEAVCSNTLLTIRLDRVPRPLRHVFVAAYYNSATLLAAERTGRSYGGGVLKLEPSEADQLLVPNPFELRSIKRARRLLARVDAFLRRGDFEDLTADIDAVFLGEICGLHEDDRSMIRASRVRRREIRKRIRGSPAAP